MAEMDRKQQIILHQMCWKKNCVVFIYYIYKQTKYYSNLKILKLFNTEYYLNCQKFLLLCSKIKTILLWEKTDFITKQVKIHGIPVKIKISFMEAQANLKL